MRRLPGRTLGWLIIAVSWALLVAAMSAAVWQAFVLLRSIREAVL